MAADDVMSSFIAVILPDESAAGAAAGALDALHGSGSIALFGRSLVVREADGSLVAREPTAPDAGAAPIGVFAQALVGAAAIAAGTAPPGLRSRVVGALGGLAGLGLGADVVEECLGLLAPGNAAILAEIGEHWLAPAEAALAALGGRIIRRQRAGIAEDLLCGEIATLEAELQALEQECERASSEARAAIRRRAAAARARLADSARIVAEMLARLQAETAARLRALEGQLEQAGSELALRIEIEARIGKALASAQAEAAQRLDALRGAQALARAALGPDPED